MAISLCGKRSFPRDLDVQVTVSKSVADTTTALNVLCCVVQDAPFRPDADRVHVYSSMEEVETEFPNTSQAWAMANAFFSQSPRAAQLAIGKAFSTAQAGYLYGGGKTGTVAEFAAVNDGSFAIAVDGGEVTKVEQLDFTGNADYTAIVATINEKLTTLSLDVTCSYNGGVFVFTSQSTGEQSTVSYLTTCDPASGTDISGAGFLDGIEGDATPFNGYTPSGIAGELTLIAQAGQCAGVYLYAWALEIDFRDTADQQAASVWAQSRVAWLSLYSNDLTAPNASVTTDIGSVLNKLGNYRTTLFWGTQAGQYPDVALAAYMLHVDYNAQNSTVTAKFKDLVGITPAGITSTDLAVLESKGYNVLTLVGNQARTVREGDTVNPQWFIDDLINLDNWQEQAQTAVFNVFLRNKKVPYTDAGAKLIYQALAQVCELFILNGSLASRQSPDTLAPTGFTVTPAYAISYTPFAQMTDAMRQLRQGPPFVVDLNLAGAIHSVSVTVNAYA